MTGKKKKKKAAFHGKNLVKAEGFATLVWQKLAKIVIMTVINKGLK